MNPTATPDPLLADLRSRLDSARTAAQEKWSAFEGAREAAKAAGLKDGSPEFKAADAAHAEYRTAADRADRAREALEEALMKGHASSRRPGAVWGDALAKAVADSGRKDLLPNGSVALPRLSEAITRIPDRPRSVLELVRFDPLDGTDGFSYLRETTRTHAAAPVAVGDVKPTSTYSLERVDDTARTIAHISEPIPRQWIGDMGLLQNYVEGSMLAGALQGLEDQIVAGDGEDENILGFTVTPNITVADWTSDPITTARAAIRAMEDDHVNIAEAVFVMAPASWEALETIHDANGSYVLDPARQPIDSARRRLWGRPVVTTTALDHGDGLAFLVDFPGSTTAREREGVRLDWTEHVFDPSVGEDGASDFARNMLRVRAEGRWGFGVTRTAGVVQFPLEDS